MQEGQHRQHNEIDAVDAAIHEKIAHNSEADHHVVTKKEETVVEDEVKASEGRIEQRTSGDKEQSAMQFGLLAPRDRERKKRAKGCHVEERNDEERLGAGQAESVRVEAAHDDGCNDTQRNHRRAKRRSKPSEEAMPFYVSRADQNGLKQEEDNPAEKHPTVEPQEERSRRRGVKEAGVDCAAEP